MPKKETPKAVILRLFDQRKCWKVYDLSRSLNYSIVSSRRFLKGIGYYSSFTHNSTWYTLKSIPVFNKRGIWFYHEIGFSKHGNLNKTIVHFINNSPQGLTAKKLSDFLLVPCHPVLNLMCKNGQIDRFGSRREFIYLSIDERKKRLQLDRLQACSIEKRETLSLC